MRKFYLLTILLFLSISKSRADEGMWLLPLLDQYNIGTMTEMGLTLSAEDIYSVNQACIKDAVAMLYLSGGVCTGEMVSPEGLLFTNHHCGYGYIQTHSTLEHNYLDDGFWAMSRQEELYCEGMAVYFLKRIEDVTDRVLANITDTMTERERNRAISIAIANITDIESRNSNYSIDVESFYSDNNFYLIEYEIYSDVRLVGAPPQSIGKFGHDTDNWEWPRHTGDFSIFRVYMSPDGKPAAYSSDNIPYVPKHYLPISIKELKEDDFAMILGYPGSTQRYYTSFEIADAMAITNANRIKIRGIKQDIWMEDMINNPLISIQYASKYSNSSNYWKNAIGQNTLLEKLDIIEKKESLENQFREWITEDPKRQEKYGDALNLIKNALSNSAHYRNAYEYLNECIDGCELFTLRRYGQSYMAEYEAGNIDGMESVKQAALAEYADYSPSTDIKSMKAMLSLYREDIDSQFEPSFYSEIIDKKFKGNTDKYVDYIFKKSIFANEESLLKFFANPNYNTLTSDPAVIFASSISAMASEIYSNIELYDNDLRRGQRLWVAALREMSPQTTQYPDANLTMRLSYGSIKNYDPKDGVTYKYYTTLDGVIDKYVPNDFEFDLPQRLIDLNKNREYGRYASKEGYLPVNFLTTNDITGGNSGSPVINGNGELIGLAFDGNWEAMSGDFQFEPDVQRTIAVDIRYVLWVIDIYAGAGYLLDELTIIE